MANLAPSIAQITALFVGGLFMTAPRPALAQERPTLPDVSELRSLTTELRTVSLRSMLAETAHARSCVLIGAAVECRCVLHSSGWEIDTLKIDDAGVITLKHASRPGVASWAVGAATLQAGAWQLDDVWRWGEDNTSALFIKQLASSAAGSISASELSWYKHSPSRSGGSCPMYGAPSSAAQLRAASATQAEDGWILEDLEVSWLELPGEQRTNEARDGVLPPTLRLNSEVFEYTHAASWSRLPVMVEAIISPQRWYGLGLLFISDDQAERPLEAAALWSKDKGFGYALFGQAVLGTSSGGHLSADMERGERASMRELRRLEQRTWLRSWQSRRMGIGLSSESLMLIGSFSADVAPWDAGSRIIGVSIGDAVQTSAMSSAEVRVEHWTAYGEEQASQHRGEMLMGWSQRWGDPRVVSARVGALGVMGLSAADGREDWRAAMRAGISGYIELGLNILGRYQNLSHYIRPSVSLVAAPDGFKTSSLGVGRILVEQRIEDARGRWYVELPMGLWADWDEERRALEVLGSAAGWDGEWVRLRLNADIICERWCARRHGMVRLSAGEERSGLTVEGSTGYADSTANLLMQQSHGSLGGMFGAEAMQRAAGVMLGEPSTLYGAGARWRGGRHKVGGELWWSGPDGGALGSYEFLLREIGWGLGAQGGWSRDGSWSAWLGLKL